MYLIFVRLLIMTYIGLTTLMLVRGFSSMVFNRNIKLSDFFLIPFWPIMILSKKGIIRLLESLGFKEKK